jgi:hypothetical protein
MNIPTPGDTPDAREYFENVAQQLGIEPRRFLLSPTGSYVDATVSGAWHFFMSGAIGVLKHIEKSCARPLQ